jgi:hypothetical protein
MGYLLYLGPRQNRSDSTRLRHDSPILQLAAGHIVDELTPFARKKGGREFGGAETGGRRAKPRGGIAMSAVGREKYWQRGEAKWKVLRSTRTPISWMERLRGGPQ